MTTDDSGLSCRELEPAFGRSLPAPHDLVGELRLRLEERVLQLRQARGEVHTPEDTYIPIRALAALSEGLTDYGRAFLKIARETLGYMQDELELAVGEQEGVPLSGLRVPDSDGTDIKIDLDTRNEYDFDLHSILTGVAHKTMTENPGMARDRALDEDAADEELFALIYQALVELTGTGTFKPQVTKVRKLADAIARTSPKVASTITGAIKKRVDFRGVKVKREQPK